MYALQKDRAGNVVAVGIENGSIPLDMQNRDYQQFLKDWEAGAEVLNPDGTPAPYVAPEAP